MDDKDRFDRLMRLVDFRLKRWDARRGYEWKISLALWGLLAAGAFYIPVRPNMYAVAILLFLVCIGYALLWLGPVLTRNDEDMNMAFYYVNRAERILGLVDQDRERPEQRPGQVSWFDIIFHSPFFRPQISVGAWSPLFQIITIAIFAVCTFWLLSTKPWPK
jgi:hypothetical protein